VKEEGLGLKYYDYRGKYNTLLRLVGGKIDSMSEQRPFQIHFSTMLLLVFLTTTMMSVPLLACRYRSDFETLTASDAFSSTIREWWFYLLFCALFVLYVCYRFEHYNRENAPGSS
jgi:hypothetical protein